MDDGLGFTGCWKLDFFLSMILWIYRKRAPTKTIVFILVPTMKMDMWRWHSLVSWGDLRAKQWCIECGSSSLPVGSTTWGVFTNQDDTTLWISTTKLRKKKRCSFLQKMYYKYLFKGQCPQWQPCGARRKKEEHGVEGVIAKKDYKGYEEMVAFRADVDPTIFEGIIKMLTCDLILMRS